MQIPEYQRTYQKNTIKSNRLYKKSDKIFPGGISHNIRFFAPYPFFVKKANGKILTDVDNNIYVDYWMGHWALILGHSPNAISRSVINQVKNGTLYGTVNKASVELAEMIQKLMPRAEKMRFASTGSEATMYAVRLARAKTMKKFVKGTIPDLEYQKAVKKPIPVRCIQIHEPFEVETMEGMMKGKAGDWLMIGVNGEMYPIANEIFRKSYDIVE